MIRWIQVKDASLRYEVTGTGDAVLVLLHEMGGTLESWDLLLPALAPGRRILRFDWRGAGASSKIRGTADLGEMADDLRALLDLLGLTAPVAIAGCAVGGAIAMRFAARYSTRTKALIAMSPATGVAAERKAATLDRARLAEEQGMHPGIDALFDATWPVALRDDEQRFSSFRAKWLSNDPYSFAAINRMLAGLDMTQDVAAIACPSLFMAGCFDQFRPPAMIRALAGTVKGSTFVELRTGHFMALQTPELVAEQMLPFLRQNGT